MWCTAASSSGHWEWGVIHISWQFPCLFTFTPHPLQGCSLVPLFDLSKGLIWESSGAGPLWLLHWPPSRSWHCLFHLETWIKNVFIVLLLVLRARPNCKRPQWAEIALSGFFFFFCRQSGLENSCGYGLLVFPSRDLGFSRVRVCFVKKFFTYSWCYLPFPWVRAFRWVSCGVLANLQEGKEQNLLAPLRMSLSSSARAWLCYQVRNCVRGLFWQVSVSQHVSEIRRFKNNARRMCSGPPCTAPIRAVYLTGL